MNNSNSSQLVQHLSGEQRPPPVPRIGCMKSISVDRDSARALPTQSTLDPGSCRPEAPLIASAKQRHVSVNLQTCHPEAQVATSTVRGIRGRVSDHPREHVYLVVRMFWK